MVKNDGKYEHITIWPFTKAKEKLDSLGKKNLINIDQEIAKKHLHNVLEYPSKKGH